LYFSSSVTQSDSLRIDSVWKAFKTALQKKDAPKVKAMSTSSVSLSIIKPGQSLAFPVATGTIDTAVEILFKIVQEPKFFSFLDESYININAIAAAEANRRLDEGLQPVIFSIFFTDLPLGSAGNKGWSFAFMKLDGNIKFFGLTQL
jgi:hypothetical protein